MNYIQTGKLKEFRPRGERGNWRVEGTDRNRVWLDAQPERAPEPCA